MFCFFCSSPSSPTSVTTPANAVVLTPVCPTLSLSHQSTPPPSSIKTSPSISKSTPPSIKSSPSQRFKHLSPEILKILAPNVEMPMLAPNCQECAARYRVQQDIIVNKLMGFIEEENQ
jgi:hypothetical protein